MTGPVLSLAAGELTATFLPDRGMLGASLRHRGEELLRDIDDHALPMHGVPWAQLAWDVMESAPDRFAVRLDWSRPDRLAVFPYPHVLWMRARLRPHGLTVRTMLIASSEGPVPVRFGFHPYLGLPGVPRVDWRLTLPGMRRLLLDGQGIPTGEDEAFAGFDSSLGAAAFDDGFALVSGAAAFTLAGGGRKVTVELDSGYPFAHVYAPAGKELVALEPMTAPTSALTTGRSLPLAAPGDCYSAAFRIRVEDETGPV